MRVRHHPDDSRMVQLLSITVYWTLDGVLGICEMVSFYLWYTCDLEAHLDKWIYHNEIGSVRDLFR